MALYVDGFVVVVPNEKVSAYKRMARKAGKVWREHGALEFRECEGDSLDERCGMPFPKLTGAKPDETVFFSFVVFQSKADRNRINKKVIADPRLAEMMDPKKPIFDLNRMAYGGFKVAVDE